MAFDLDEHVLRIRLQLADHLIEPRLGLVRQVRCAELEVALVFAQGDFVDQLARRGDVGGDCVHASADRLGVRRRGVSRRACFTRGAAGIRRRLAGGFGLLIDRADALLVLADALLRLLDGAAQGVDLRVDAADLFTNEPLGRARRGHGHAQRDHCCCTGSYA